MTTDVNWGEVPGWIALALVIADWARRWWGRRRSLAVGPAPEALRSALTDTRRALTDLLEEGRRQEWFAEEGRSELATRLRDEARRVGDETLRAATLVAADAWTGVSDAPPPSRRGRAYFLGDSYPEHYRREDAEDEARMGRQRQGAAAGMNAISDALDRLTELERAAHGR